ncbi:putative E3 ubiquitin-protein ligase UBR7 [Olea europaea var. sylvestris]|uniref:putative E3 ubiquitin-protein ligase UBR7 n=1 Tax=Olea europaea var. sylvestris TaxID=158386 RepID=UPI000C1CCFB2|nr:putative E3 ubiquitin-protein ligase UBR7 [Olea europaea var. sylvestris]
MTDVFEGEGEGEGEADPTISIGDYLKAVEEEDLEADLVLGGDEGKECTYNKGYMKRQAIFSCLTCTPEGNAGVCTACSLSCHDGHEIVELWTKRNFRCDCGNSKFGEFFCKLFPNKDVENLENKYNHNFKGTYCTCDLPYPDPNAEEQVEMIQCCICEDWFHEEHIGLQSSDEIPRDEEGEPLYEDFICQGCAAVCSFLTYYLETISALVSNSNVANLTKEKAVLEDLPSSMKSSGKLEHGNCSLNTVVTNANAEGTTNECSQAAGSSKKCTLGINLAETPLTSDNSKSMFLFKNWREVICRCDTCSYFYTQKGISFLLDKEDSIAEYEKVAKQKRDENLQKQEGDFLNTLGHVEKMEILSGIADMKDEIRSFLESSDPSKPITTADIHQVFDNLAKKRKRNP